MNSVMSKDGTSIAYERSGSGPAVILIGGGIDDGAENAAHVPELARHFTAYNYPAAAAATASTAATAATTPWNARSKTSTP
jgi:hypothetical protein